MQGVVLNERQRLVKPKEVFNPAASDKPTAFGSSGFPNWCNGCFSQAAALVHVYLDGSVLLTHGGCELGQGLYTKMIQVRQAFVLSVVKGIELCRHQASYSHVESERAHTLHTQANCKTHSVLQGCKNARGWGRELKHRKFDIILPALEELSPWVF